LNAKKEKNVYNEVKPISTTQRGKEMSNSGEISRGEFRSQGGRVLFEGVRGKSYFDKEPKSTTRGGR